MDLKFEWDESKAAGNLKKHKVSFEEAKTVFSDPFSITIDDPEHSADEMRFIDIGSSANGTILGGILYRAKQDSAHQRS